MTHHVVKETLVFIVLLYNGVPMKIVSELLERSKIKATQEHYAKIICKSLSKKNNRLLKIVLD